MSSRSRSARAPILWVVIAVVTGVVAGSLGAPAGAEDGPRHRRRRRAEPAPTAAPRVPPEEEAAPAEAAAPPEPTDAVLTSTTTILDTPMPEAWMPRGRRCARSRGRLICDGPRRAPRPFGEAAALARTLGIGTRTMASHVLVDPPEPEWIAAAAAAGEARDTLLWPVPEGHFWRGFGQREGRARRRARTPHLGIDIGAPDGTPIRAVNDALVIYSDNEVRGYGNLLMLLHPDGAVTFYAHCVRTVVFAGQHVRRGQLIGQVGHTGLARGSHLHFEWRRNARARNPIRHMVGIPEDAGVELPHGS